MLLIHHAQHKQSVAFDLLYEVPIEGQCLEGGNVLELLDLLQVGDVVTMQVDGFDVRELQQLSINGLQVVVGEVEPLKVVGLPHNVVQDVAEAS